MGRPLHDSGGDHLGDVSGVYFNDADRSLEWVSVAVLAGVGQREAGQDVAASGVEQKFVPAGSLRPTPNDRLTMTFSRDMLVNQPHIEAHDGALSNAQVARLHEFFHTFDGHSRITTASEGEPAPAAVLESDLPFTGRHHEPAFGTGSPGPREPHDVTLQAPETLHPEGRSGSWR